MLIYCYGCDRNVKPYLTTGTEVLPFVMHLRQKNFWKCSDCGNFVGTRTVRDNEYAARGPIATKKIRKFQKELRSDVAFILEAKKSTPDAKKILYEWLSKKLFYPYRTASICSKSEAKMVKVLLEKVKKKC